MSHINPPFERIEYDEETETYSFIQATAPAENPLVSVLWAVATIEDIKPVDLTPISDWIDPDSLNRLFDSPAGNQVILSFPYNGYQVIINGNDDIKIAWRQKP